MLLIFSSNKSWIGDSEKPGFFTISEITSFIIAISIIRNFSFNVSEKTVEAMLILRLDGVWKIIPEKENSINIDKISNPNYDDSEWFDIRVPGHWQEDVGDLKKYSGVVWYRKKFNLPEKQGKIWLVFLGVFYRAEVWLNGKYLGEHSGYFAPFKFDITNVAREGENVLVVRVESFDEKNINRKKQVGGIFYHWDCRDPTFNPGGIWRSVEIHRTGEVWFERIKIVPSIEKNTAKLRILFWLGSEYEGNARIHLQLEPKNFEGEPQHYEIEVAVSRGINRYETVITLENPKLWWTWDLGNPNLYKLISKVIVADNVSDEKEVVFGIKEVKLIQKHDGWTFYLNGRKIFLRGTNYGPTDQRLAWVTRERIENDARLMREANINAVRIHAHVNPLAWEVFDEYGILVWQDMPLQWSYDKSVKRDALNNARELVYLTENHASVGILCAHNEPFLLPDASSLMRSALAFMLGLVFSAFLGSIAMKLGILPIKGVWRDIFLFMDRKLLGFVKLGWLISIVVMIISMFPGFALMFGGIEAIIYLLILGMLIPWDIALIWSLTSFILSSPLTALTYNWNKSVLDRKIVRILKEEDMGVHPVVKYSGGMGWFMDGTDTHIYDGWYTGWLTFILWLRGYRHIRTFIGPFRGVFRCVSEFGFQAFPNKENLLKILPQNIANAIQKNFREAYPDMARYLKEYHQYQPEFMRIWVKYQHFETLEKFIEETQKKQAELLKFYVEFLRAHKYNPTGGIFQFMFTDIAPLVTWAVIDYWREPKKAYHTLKEVYQPVLPVMDWPSKGKTGRKYRTRIYLINDLHRDLVGEIRVKLDGKVAFTQKVALGSDSVRTIPVTLRLPERKGIAEVLLELDLESYGVVVNKYSLIIN